MKLSGNTLLKMEIIRMSKRILLALCAGSLLFASTAAQATSGCYVGSLYFENCDPSNLAYGSAININPGTAFPATRGLWATCTSGGGTTTVTLANGGSVTWTIGTGSQQQPLYSVGVTAVTGCSFYGLN